MQCPVCKEEVPEGKYCDQCGELLIKQSTQQPVQQDLLKTIIVESKETQTTTELSPAQKYEVLQLIGSGGMAYVYKAIDKTTNRYVAIKTYYNKELCINRRERDKFFERCKMVALLEHENIVKLYEWYIQNEQICVVFEYVPGKNLEELLNEYGKLPIKKALQIILPVVKAIGYAHSQKIVHRDIKPSNIIVNEEPFIVKVTDFDIAQHAKLTISTLTGREISGTPVYMAPEQHCGRYDTRSDIFSIGVTLYEMITGNFPYYGTPTDLIYQKQNNLFRPIEEVSTEVIPQEIKQIIEKCLQADPQNRFTSAEELQNVVENIINKI